MKKPGILVSAALAASALGSYAHANDLLKVPEYNQSAFFRPAIEAAIERYQSAVDWDDPGQAFSKADYTKSNWAIIGGTAALTAGNMVYRRVARSACEESEARHGRVCTELSPPIHEPVYDALIAGAEFFILKESFELRNSGHKNRRKYWWVGPLALGLWQGYELVHARNVHSKYD